MPPTNRNGLMMRLGFFVVLCAGLFPGLSWAAAPQPEAARPNIILAMTDDQGWGDVSYNGLKLIQTPALDAMATAGLRMNRFYAAAPLCSPTRASVMTGRHPNRMGTFTPGRPLRPQEMTIAQAVKQAGYLTGHFGKWHLNGVSGPGKPIAADDPLNPGRFGFDEWLSVSNYFDLNWTLSRKGKDEKFSGDGSEYIVGEAVKFIGAAVEQKKPFLAVVWFGNPHVPHEALPADREKAGGSAYYGEILAIDRSMGRLRSELRKLGIAENTLLWFCSDNGAAAPGSTGGLRGRKASVWEGGLRVPGLIEWPARIKKPTVTDVPACTSDIYPTIVDILKLKVPNQVEPLDGISLLPLLEGRMKERPRPIGFWHYAGGGGAKAKAGGAKAKAGGGFTKDAGHAAWTDNRYKLHKLPAGQYELYDLLSDPNEQTDLAEKHPEIVAAMKTALEKWQESVVQSFRGEDYPKQ
jgi:arylsulfatase A-like enzyme